MRSDFCEAGPCSTSQSHDSPKPKRSAGDATRRKLPTDFSGHLPVRPFCTDDLAEGIHKRKKSAALRRRFIQLNDEAVCEWLPFDIDRPGAYYAAEDANLPSPNVVMVNRANGHAHAAYLLATPALKHSNAHLEPLKYLASIQRGFTNRLDADKRFVGLIVKNPAHADWFVEWRRDQPYSFDELNDWLFDEDKRFDPRPQEQFGLGRNCTAFDDLRTFAYREVLNFKRKGASFAEFRDRLIAVGTGINTQFSAPMNLSEVRAIANSVSKWTWRRFSPEQFSKIQSHRGKAGMAKRWAGHVAESTSKPWLALGISRRTYYRRKKEQNS